MKKHVLLSLFSGLAILLPPGVQAQLNSNLVFIPGKLAVYRGGDGLVSFAAKDRQFPAYIDEYDPAITNQGSPILTVPLPTNSPTASMWFNLHAGSEGQGITRSADRQYLALTGYTSPINEALGTPSSATNGDGTPSFYRGFGTLDAFTNLNVEYSDLYDWYGLPPGVTQDNPRGIATDGTNNFWGAGTVAGTQSGGDVELSGTLFRNSSVNEGVPVAIQSIVQSSDFVKIINNVLYMVCQTGTGGALNNGIYTFSDIPGNPMPLPWLPGTEQVTADTNLYLNFGSYGNILTFDMDPSNTTVYAADNDFGIVKFVNNGGVWTTAYVFGPTNIGTTAQTAAGNQGCFGITVDFSYTTTNYPVIYATTMEAGDSSGDVTSNRLISIVDTGNPGTNMVAQTLARANGPNEGFRGLDFTPDLRPLITTQPVNVSTTTNTLASFSVSASSVYPLSYQWQFNGTNVSNNSNYPIITGATTNILNFHDAQLTNQGNYTVIVTNLYGAVTSSVAILTVTATAVPPSLTNAVEHLTNYIGDTVTISATPKGTDPFTYQWYFNNNPLSDDGVKYSGSTNSTLTITNVQYEVDSGNYSIAITNDAGQISNLVAVLTVEYQAPFIGSGGEPESIALLQGQTGSLTVSAGGTSPLTYQWYQGNTKPVTSLSNTGEFSGTTSNTLTITGATPTVATNYFCVISDPGGSYTSAVASVSVIIPPTASFVGYSNQVYSQDFDSLPNPGLTSVNTSGGGGPVTIGTVTYDVANPFDFAFPVYFTNQPVDGLGLSNTMPGWYGECDGDTGGAQLGASWGDQTTGGIISFGLTNSLTVSSNRAFGLIATSTSGATHFGLKLINETTNNLNYINLQFVGEYWKLGTRSKTMTFTYLIDPAGNNSTFSSNEIASALGNTVDSLAFSFPTAPVGPTNGTLPVNQTNLMVMNQSLSTAWTPGSALWVIWSINDNGGSGQGYAIDNLSFFASTVPVVQTVSTLNQVAYTSGNGLGFSFTNVPAASQSFTIWATTNLALPFNQWQNLGNPTEVPAGTYSTYKFVDAQATNKPQRFYRVTSP